MGIFIEDVERELVSRIAPVQPVLAPRLAQRLMQLPPAEVAAVLASEEGLSQALEWAISQELQECLPQQAQAAPAQAAPAAQTSPQPPASPMQMMQSCLDLRAPQSPMMYQRMPGQACGGASEAEFVAARVAQLQPELAGPIVAKILELGPRVLAECVASDEALQQRVDAALGALRRDELLRREQQQPQQPSPPAKCEEALPQAEAPKLASYRATSPLRGAPPLAVASPMRAPRSMILDPVRGRSLSPDVRALAGSQLPPAAAGGAGRRRIWGLEDFLLPLGLEHYTLAASDWASSMGAVSLEELLENQEDFADALGLRPLERSRLAQQGVAVAAQLTRLRPREVLFRGPVHVVA